MIKCDGRARKSIKISLSEVTNHETSKRHNFFSGTFRKTIFCQNIADMYSNLIKLVWSSSSHQPMVKTPIFQNFPGKLKFSHVTWSQKNFQCDFRKEHAKIHSTTSLLSSKSNIEKLGILYMSFPKYAVFSHFSNNLLNSFLNNFWMVNLEMTIKKKSEQLSDNLPTFREVQMNHYLHVTYK